ncbi:MAG: hypothetical protein P8R54_03265 [Myxococcota bacterium]|nr:hypothetical protein [Myxococcota bacterium]
MSLHFIKPTTFDPNDLDTAQSQVFFSSNGDSWNVDVGWIAMNLDGVPEGQDAYQELESLMGGSAGGRVMACRAATPLP